MFGNRQKYSAARRIFNSLLGVSSGDETLHLMFDILLEKRITIDMNFLYSFYKNFRVLWLKLLNALPSVENKYFYVNVRS